MPETTCSKDHTGSIPEKVLDQLPDSQASVWRHKCAACAYELGLEDGKAEMIRLYTKASKEP